jgi:hypothetical protein
MTPPVAAITYFLPSEERNKLRNNEIMFAWRHRPETWATIAARRDKVNDFARRPLGISRHDCA